MKLENLGFHVVQNVDQYCICPECGKFTNSVLYVGESKVIYFICFCAGMLDYEWFEEEE